MKEYEEVEELTATSLNADRASSYGGAPFMMIYVPNERVFGVPIYCDEKGQGTNKDAEILLVDPSLREIQEFTGVLPREGYEENGIDIRDQIYQAIDEMRGHFKLFVYKGRRDEEKDEEEDEEEDEDHVW